MIVPDFDSDRFFLGNLCRNKHEWGNTGKSLRYKNGKQSCVICIKNGNAKRPFKRPGILSMPKEELFWTCVDKSLGDDACWSWLKSPNSSTGHCLFRIGKGKRVGAHRYAYELVHGTIPEGMCICHHCDNPRCVNPKHLFLGTIQDNNADMVAKKRNIMGEKHFKAKLTAEQVLEIREKAKSKRPYEIAREYNVSNECIYYLLSGKTWKHI